MFFQINATFIFFSFFNKILKRKFLRKRFLYSFHILSYLKFLILWYFIKDHYITIRVLGFFQKFLK